MIQVFKFGGASIKDANGIKNVASIILNYVSNPLLVVVSALGKTTNTLEKLTNAYCKNNKIVASEIFEEIKNNHIQILQTLDIEKSVLDALFSALKNQLTQPPHNNYDFNYDQIVSYGELFSTTIVSNYLSKIAVENVWMDARNLIKTDANYCDVNILWPQTEQAISTILHPQLKPYNVIITQGFIGSTNENNSTTLGREGSDYSASIFSYCLQANSLTIWKDVPGVMNADPKQFNNAEIISELSYHEAIEMTYYGAKVIHPKTIKPIQNRKIKLHVRSFIDTQLKGTIITETDKFIHYPCIKVLKQNQILLSIQTRDFSFIAEKHLQKIFEVFATYRIKMNVMQNGAISFSCCVDANDRITDVIDALQFEFKILQNNNLQLATIRHYNDITIFELTSNKEILLEQKTRNTIQLVLK
ncbi:MAG: hypothetical protein RIQ33_881 [Bacteroidota bacterium]|jgi:aspartate kinase